MANIPDPVTRKEHYFAFLTGQSTYYPEPPITREEQYLYYLCKNGMEGGNITPEQIQEAVDKYLKENPPSIAAGTQQVDHGTSDTTFTIPPNQLHIWGEVASLTLTFGPVQEGIVNEYSFSFTSGATPTTLSLPEDVQTDIVVEASTRYECSIVNDYMLFREWEVTA